MRHGSMRFVREKICDALARPDEMSAVAVDDDLAGARARIVVGAHHEAVGAGGAHGEEVALGERELAIAREEIAALAHGSDDLPAARGSGARAHRLDRMPGVVERGPEEVVHRRVDDREIVTGSGLEVDDAGQQHAGVADEEPARFEDEFLPARDPSAWRTASA